VVRVLPTGAIELRGDLLLETAGGPMAERRAFLCGCGRSTNQPFCDGRCERPGAESAG
jgi:CDGSH-type Zn-finger protein